MNVQPGFNEAYTHKSWRQVWRRALGRLINFSSIGVDLLLSPDSLLTSFETAVEIPEAGFIKQGEVSWKEQQAISRLKRGDNKINVC